MPFSLPFSLPSLSLPPCLFSTLAPPPLPFSIPLSFLPGFPLPRGSYNVLRNTLHLPDFSLHTLANICAVVSLDSMFQVHNLKYPYETNCTDYAIKHLPGYTKYTRSACMLSCHSKYLVDACGCKDIKILCKYYIKVPVTSRKIYHLILYFAQLTSEKQFFDLDKTLFL